MEPHKRLDDIFTESGIDLAVGGNSISLSDKGIDFTGTLIINGQPYTDHVHHVPTAPKTP